MSLAASEEPALAVADLELGSAAATLVAHWLLCAAKRERLPRLGVSSVRVTARWRVEVREAAAVEVEVPRSPEDTVFCRWMDGDLSSLEYLVELNRLAGRRGSSAESHPVVPWVSGMKSKDDLLDLGVSRFRAKKGDRQCELAFEGAVAEKDRHHVPESLSELGFLLYTARIADIEVLTQKVRRKFDPKEYPQNVREMLESTPEEAIPELYTEPEIFKSRHKDAGLQDLGLPEWCDSPEDFVEWHRGELEHPRVSGRLHQWIDLVFGYKLVGQEAIKAKNVFLKPRHGKFNSEGPKCLFSKPHPARRTTFLGASTYDPMDFSSRQEQLSQFSRDFMELYPAYYPRRKHFQENTIPELARREDLFALGCIIAELFSPRGSRPFRSALDAYLGNQIPPKWFKKLPAPIKSAVELMTSPDSWVTAEHILSDELLFSPDCRYVYNFLNLVFVIELDSEKIDFIRKELPRMLELDDAYFELLIPELLHLVFKPRIPVAIVSEFLPPVLQKMGTVQVRTIVIPLLHNSFNLIDRAISLSKDTDRQEMLNDLGIAPVFSETTAITLLEILGPLTFHTDYLKSVKRVLLLDSPWISIRACRVLGSVVCYCFNSFLADFCNRFVFQPFLMTISKISSSRISPFSSESQKFTLSKEILNILSSSIRHCRPIVLKAFVIPKAYEMLKVVSQDEQDYNVKIFYGIMVIKYVLGRIQSLAWSKASYISQTNPTRDLPTKDACGNIGSEEFEMEESVRLLEIIFMDWQAFDEIILRPSYPIEFEPLLECVELLCDFFGIAFDSFVRSSIGNLAISSHVEAILIAAHALLNSLIDLFGLLIVRVKFPNNIPSNFYHLSIEQCSQLLNRCFDVIQKIKGVEFVELRFGDLDSVIPNKKRVLDIEKNVISMEYFSQESRIYVNSSSDHQSTDAIGSLENQSLISNQSAFHGSETHYLEDYLIKYDKQNNIGLLGFSSDKQLEYIKLPDRISSNHKFRPEILAAGKLLNGGKDPIRVRCHPEKEIFAVYSSTDRIPTLWNFESISLGEGTIQFESNLDCALGDCLFLNNCREDMKFATYSDYLIQIFDVNRKFPIFTSTLPYKVTCIDQDCSAGLLCGSADGAVVYVDRRQNSKYDNGLKIFRLPCKSDYTPDMNANPTESRVVQNAASQVNSSSISVSSFNAPNRISSAKYAQQTMRTIAAQTNGHLVAVGLEDGCIIVFDLRTGVLIDKWIGHGCSVVWCHWFLGNNEPERCLVSVDALGGSRAWDSFSFGRSQSSPRMFLKVENFRSLSVYQATSGLLTNQNISVMHKTLLVTHGNLLLSLDLQSLDCPAMASQIPIEEVWSIRRFHQGCKITNRIQSIGVLPHQEIIITGVEGGMVYAIGKH